MAVVLVLSGDLMFASRLLASFGESGEAELIGGERALRERLADARQSTPTVLVADLTDDRFDAIAMVESLRADGLVGSLGTLAFYSHVDAEVRRRAQEAGFDLVVPRSRMAREGAAVLSGLGGG